jgi:hypothetical protein
MGPEEYISREEMGVMIKFAVAKIYQQGEIIAALTNLLVSEGVLSDQKLNSMLLKLKESPIQKRAQETLKTFQDFAAIHKIARQYLDPQEE